CARRIDDWGWYFDVW
nr:immunoglobulin heavy chain junction region [Mus musculus]